LKPEERRKIAGQIATGALRYFMLKFTKSSVIAFDFKEALSFEGETGPYAQYAVVRATNIFRKGGIDADEFTRAIDAQLALEDLKKYLTSEDANEIWELWLATSKTSYVIEQCIAITELAYLAKHEFQIAQIFIYFTIKKPFLQQADVI